MAEQRIKLAPKYSVNIYFVFMFIVMTEFCDQSYSEGCKAYLSGKPSDANPYPPGSKQHGNWRAGWTDLALIAALTVKQEESDRL